MQPHPTHTEPASPVKDHHAHEHPTARTYIIIAAVLTFLTALEIGVYYFPPPLAALVIILAVLAVAKFVLVVGFYMHLKFDAKLYTWLFAGGFLTATAALTGLWALFNGWGG